MIRSLLRRLPPAYRRFTMRCQACGKVGLKATWHRTEWDEWLTLTCPVCAWWTTEECWRS